MNIEKIRFIMPIVTFLAIINALCVFMVAFITLKKIYIG